MLRHWCVNTCVLIAVASISAGSGEPLRAAGESWYVSDMNSNSKSVLSEGATTPSPMLDEEAAGKTSGEILKEEPRIFAAPTVTVPRADRWWFSADYLLWWTNGNSVPPLVSTNSDVPARDQAGVIGAPTTQVLVGGELDEGGRSGTELSAGYWLDDCHCWGLQATWWYVGDPSDELNDAWTSDGDPVLARPFYNTASSAEDAQLVAFSNELDGDIVAGTVEVATSSDLRSAEALLSMKWYDRSCVRFDLLGGYRYLRFREGLLIQENLVAGPDGAIQQGTTIGLFDRFDTSNSFHGATLGVLTNWQRGCFQLDVAAKLGVGNVQRRVRVDGQTVVTTPDPNDPQSVVDTGLLALSSNAGRHEDDTFGLLPELNVEGRVFLTECLSVDVGYNLLFLTQVYRTGDQIDRNINPGLIGTDLHINDNSPSGMARPAAQLDSSTLCVQGLNVGCTLSY